MNPYQSPTKAIAPPVMQPFRWLRIFSWAALIYVTAMVIGLSFGISMSYWEMYGSTMESAIVNARLIRQIIYGIVATILYWRLAAPVQKRFLHVVAAFLTVQFIDLMVAYFVFGAPVDELIELWALRRSLLPAVIGLGLASLGSNYAIKGTSV